MAENINLTTEELAARWRMSPNTLRIWRSLGKGISYNKYGERVTYSLADIEAYEKDNKVKIIVD